MEPFGQTSAMIFCLFLFFEVLGGPGDQVRSNLALFLVILGVLGSMLGHVGGKMRQDSDQEHQVEPNMGGWRLPDGKC